MWWRMEFGRDHCRSRGSPGVVCTVFSDESIDQQCCILFFTFPHISTSRFHLESVLSSSWCTMEEFGGENSDVLRQMFPSLMLDAGSEQRTETDVSIQPAWRQVQQHSSCQAMNALEWWRSNCRVSVHRTTQHSCHSAGGHLVLFYLMRTLRGVWKYWQFCSNGLG